MSKTETTVSNLKINTGTYANISANASSIGEDELIITEDKSIPIPTSSDNGKVVGVVNGDFSLVTPSGGGGGTLTMDLLWTNQSATSDFNAQTISSLNDISNYDYILIDFRNYKENESALTQIFKSKIDGMGFLTSNFVASSIEYRRTRRFTLAQTSITFEDNYQMASNATTPAINNACLIPVQIIGIKLVNN